MCQRIKKAGEVGSGNYKDDTTAEQASHTSCEVPNADDDGETTPLCYLKLLSLSNSNLNTCNIEFNGIDGFFVPFQLQCHRLFQL